MPLEVWKSLRISVGKVRFELLENIKSFQMRYVRILGYFRGFPDWDRYINIKRREEPASPTFQTIICDNFEILGR